MSTSKGAIQVAEPAGQKQVQQVEREGTDETRGEESRPASGDSGSLWQDVCGLSQAFRELETQLRQQLRVNQTLESDLASARRRMAELVAEREGLRNEIARMRPEALSGRNSKAELERLRRERQALAGKVEDLGQALAASEQRVLEIIELLDRLRAERDGASQEVVCLEAQFARAMKVIGELKGELDAHLQRDRAIEGRIRRLQQTLEVAGRSESGQIDPADTRRALEEIRQSFLYHDDG